MMNRLLPLALSAVLLACSALNCSADEPETKPDIAGQSLDQQLLDGLDSDLLDGLDDVAPTKNGEPPERGVEPPSRQSDSPPHKTGPGEDVELGKPTDPLTRIGERMQTVKELIAGKNTSIRTQQLQQEIVEDLNALIKRQQMLAAAQSKSERDGRQQGNSRPGDGQGTDAAQDSPGPEKSTDRLGSANLDGSDQRSRTDIYKEAWGELPERYVQQMLSAGVEEFLPKYARLIEEYYTRLTEDK